MTDEATQRAAVVAEAKTWIGTPYHSCARIKGVGVDCGQLPLAVYHAAGRIREVPVDQYSPQWHLHREEERYLAQVLEFAHEISELPLPGDFVLWRVGRCLAHGAIVVDWPVVIHSAVGIGVVQTDAIREPVVRVKAHQSTERERHFFSVWGA